MAKTLTRILWWGWSIRWPNWFINWWMFNGIKVVKIWYAKDGNHG